VVAFQANEPTADRTRSPAVMRAIEGVRAQDTDEARSVLADVLEESGDVAGAQYVRLEQTLQRTQPTAKGFVEQVRALRSLGQVTGPTFRYLVGRDIDGCAGVRWSFRCPKRWESMQVTSGESERVCQSCRQIVTRVSGGADAERMAADGGCVSIAAPTDESWEGELAAEPEEDARVLRVGSVVAMPPRRDTPPAPVVRRTPPPPRPWWKRLFAK
jgi:hypothetical protein